MAPPVNRMTGRAARLAPRWLARLKRELDQPPSRPRWPLELRCSGRAAASIGSVEPMLAQRMVDAGLPLRKIGRAWSIEVGNAAAIDLALGALAQWLHAQGLATAWRDEPLAVTDAHGLAVAAIERAAVRPLGIARHAVHLGATWSNTSPYSRPLRRPGSPRPIRTARSSVSSASTRRPWSSACMPAPSHRRPR